MGALGAGKEVVIYRVDDKLQVVRRLKVDMVVYVVAWSRRKILAVAGEDGRIAILSRGGETVASYLRGHTGDVLDLKFHPKIPWLLLSSSEDHMMRLWDVRRGVCLAIIGSASGSGHKLLQPIPSVDWHASGKKFVCCSYGFVVQIWELGSKVDDEIQWSEQSHTTYLESGINGTNDTTTTRQPVYVTEPAFATNEAHWNATDCVRWYGDAVLSKSVDVSYTESTVLLWKPGDNGQIQALREFHYPNDPAIYYTQFAVNDRWLVVGNSHGHIFVWELQTFGPGRKVVLTKKHQVLYDVAFIAPNTVLAVADEGQLYRVDVSKCIAT